MTAYFRPAGRKAVNTVFDRRAEAESRMVKASSRTFLSYVIRCGLKPSRVGTEFEDPRSVGGGQQGVGIGNHLGIVAHPALPGGGGGDCKILLF